MIGHTLSHYRIIRKLGEGGMGEVFLAEDANLKRTVALKILPAEFADDAMRLARFRREAETVAALSHPNIVTIFSIEESDGTQFLTMEHVEGESLDRSLPRGGLPLAKIFDLAIPLADALSAAHGRGIVHRDLKPANIMVTKEGHLKVLDFGLAKLTTTMPGAPADPDITSAQTREAGDDRPLTGEGTVIGTVPYMSPEQLQGKEVDHRTDIFSLGVILYELAAGQRPFAGESSAEIISSIMRDTPAPLHERDSSLPRHLGRIVAHCLEKDAEQRFQSAKDIRNELKSLRREIDSDPSVMTAERSAVPSGPLPAVRSGDLPPARSGAPRWLWPVVGIAALAIAGTLFVMMRGAGDSAAPEQVVAPPVVADINVRRSVAVLGFKNLAARDDKAWLSTALSEMLTTELSAGGELRTVPGENIAQMKRNLALSEGDTYSPETLGKIRDQLGSDFVVLGSFLTLGEASGGQIRLDLRLQDTAAGETVASLSETGTEADLLSLVASSGARLREELGTAATTAEQREALRATVPADPEAARLYTEGLTAMRRLDRMEASKRLEAAAKIDPQHPMILMTLSEAQIGLGYDAEALASAERAFQYSGSLPEAHRLAVEGRYREEQRDWEQAIEVYRAAWEAEPDNLAAGLRLAGAQEVNREEEALETLAALRSLPPPQGIDPRIDLLASNAEHDLGRFEAALDSARRAAARAEELDAPLLRASALAQAAWVLEQVGKKAEARSTAEAALAIHDEIGHPSERADTLNVLANILIEPHEAIALYEEVLAISHDIGSREIEAAALNNLAIRLGNLGDLERQKEMYEQSLALTEEFGNKLDYAIILGNLAANCIFRGDWETGGRYQEEALRIAREQGARSMEATMTFVIGVRSMAEGRLDEGRELLAEARRIQIDAGAGDSTSGVIRFLGWIEFLEDRPDRARERLEEALAIVERQGYPGSGTRNFLATIELGEGRPERAERLARRAREAAIGPGTTHRASALLARALADQGRGTEAEEHLRQALEGIRDSQNFITRTVVGLNAAKVELALSRPDEARRRLETIHEEAAAVGWVEIEVESRLLLARLGRGPGDTIADRAVLKAVEEDARSYGLLRFARLAAEAADWEN